MSDDSSPSRRTVLKQLGTAAAGGIAAGATAGAAAANDGDDALEMESRPVADVVGATGDTEGALERAVETHAGSLLELLAEEGVIESADASVVATTPVSPYTDDSVEGASAYAVGEDGSRGLLTFDTHVAGGTVRLSIEPDQAVAAVEYRRDDGARIFYGDLGDGPQKGRERWVKPCCKCCVCSAIACPEGPAKFCYGPKRFGCPFAPDGCPC